MLCLGSLQRTDNQPGYAELELKTSTLHFCAFKSSALGTRSQSFNINSGFGKGSQPLGNPAFDL